MLGVALAKVELNETNFSEVLRLFVLSRNAGDPHPVTNAFHSIYLPGGGSFLNSFCIGKGVGGRGSMLALCCRLCVPITLVPTLFLVVLILLYF